MSSRITLVGIWAIPDVILGHFVVVGTVNPHGKWWK